MIEPAKRADTVRHAATDPERTDDPAAADGSYTEIMSFGQQRLWVLDQLLPDRSLYNTPRVQCLLGPLDVSALEAGIGEILRRHDALRTSISVVDGEPRERVAPPAPFHLPVDELSGPGGMPEAEARRRAEAFCRAPFDLEHGPLCTALLLRLGPDRHWLLLNLHHIITDYWSTTVFARELAVLYDAFHRGQASPLPPLPVQYADFAVWQRERLQGAALTRQLEYWRNTLADLPSLELAWDHPRPATASARGGRVQFTIEPALTAGLKSLALREGATLFMTLLAAFQVLLHRYSGQDDIAVGVPIAGRNRPELESLIGFFVNTLVLRGTLSGDPTFLEYLGRVRERSLDAYAHQDLPFEKLVEELAPSRDLSRNPLFQVSFALQNAPPPAWRLTGLEVSTVEDIIDASAKFDLSFSVGESAGELRGRIDYAAALFDHATVVNMAVQWRCLLAAIATHPAERISRLALHSASERGRLLAEGNRVVSDFSSASVHRLFAEQAVRTPAATAVRDGDVTLSYGELDARANQLARFLGGKGVQRGSIVAVAMERGPWMTVTLLGILKAGAAYLPLDPALPHEWLASMLEDAGQPPVLTLQPLLARCPPGLARVFCIDRD